MTDLTVDIEVKRYPPVARAEAHVALRDVRLAVRHGEFVCITGPSGCGKTTLLNIIARLDRDFEGQVVLPRVPGGGEPVIGYVFQEPRLLPWYTVLQNIELVLTPTQIESGIVDDLLAAARLDRFRNTYPQRLSLGMSRRAALVRAFAVQPDLMLLDEPFVSLDEPTAQRLRTMLLDILALRPTTVVFVTHNVREAIFLADRIVLMSPAPGSVVADVPVSLDRVARNDPGEVEAFRTRLLSAHPMLSADLSGHEPADVGVDGRPPK